MFALRYPSNENWLSRNGKTNSLVSRGPLKKVVLPYTWGDQRDEWLSSVIFWTCGRMFACPAIQDPLQYRCFKPHPLRVLKVICISFHWQNQLFPNLHFSRKKKSPNFTVSLLLFKNLPCFIHRLQPAIPHLSMKNLGVGFVWFAEDAFMSRQTTAVEGI